MTFNPSLLFQIVKGISHYFKHFIAQMINVEIKQ